MCPPTRNFWFQPPLYLNIDLLSVYIQKSSQAYNCSNFFIEMKSNSCCWKCELQNAKSAMLRWKFINSWMKIWSSGSTPNLFSNSTVITQPRLDKMSHMSNLCDINSNYWGLSVRPKNMSVVIQTKVWIFIVHSKLSIVQEDTCQQTCLRA